MLHHSSCCRPACLVHATSLLASVERHAAPLLVLYRLACLVGHATPLLALGRLACLVRHALSPLFMCIISPLSLAACPGGLQAISSIRLLSPILFTFLCVCVCGSLLLGGWCGVRRTGSGKDGEWDGGRREEQRGGMTLNPPSPIYHGHHPHSPKEAHR